MLKFITDNYFTPITIITIALSFIGIIISIFHSKIKFDSKIQIADDNEISSIIEKYTNLLQNQIFSKKNDVIELMQSNLLEIKEYFAINKQQARKSFSTALYMCVLGFILYAAGLIIGLVFNKNFALYSTIAGTIIELISGLFFYIYNKSIKQINIFFGSLLDTQRYLFSIQLVDKIKQNKDFVYAYIISSIMGKNDININDIVMKSKE